MNTPIIPVPADSIAVTVPLVVKCQRIQNLICTAFEGGSNDWLHSAAFVSGIGPVPSYNVVWYGREGFFAHPFAFDLTFDDPDKDEGNGKGRKRITNADLAPALALMAQNHPSHFADFMGENEDATTADVFMQMLVLGELVYG